MLLALKEMFSVYSVLKEWNDMVLQCVYCFGLVCFNLLIYLFATTVETHEIDTVVILTSSLSLRS